MPLGTSKTQVLDLTLCGCVCVCEVSLCLRGIHSAYYHRCHSAVPGTFSKSAGLQRAAGEKHNDKQNYSRQWETENNILKKKQPSTSRRRRATKMCNVRKIHPVTLLQNEYCCHKPENLNLQQNPVQRMFSLPCFYLSVLHSAASSITTLPQ